MVPIPGTKRLERMVENAGAADIVLSVDDFALLDAVPQTFGARY